MNTENSVVEIFAQMGEQALPRQTRTSCGFAASGKSDERERAISLPSIGLLFRINSSSTQQFSLSSEHGQAKISITVAYA